MDSVDSSRQERPNGLTYKHRDLQRGIEHKLQLSFSSGSERNAWIQIDGRAVLRVTLPKVHSGDVREGTLGEIRKQLALTKAQFELLISCPMTGPQYEELIREKVRTGTLPPARWPSR